MQLGRRHPLVFQGHHHPRRALLALQPGVVQNGRFMGYTESGQSRANQGIPRFACNPDLNHAGAAITPEALAGTSPYLNEHLNRFGS